MSRLLRNPLTLTLVVVLLGVGATAGLYWFQPWKLVTDTAVSDTLSSPAPAAAASAPAAAPTSAPASAVAGPVVVAESSFVTHEHETTGTVRLVRKPDRSHQLEFVGLDTSDGPDLRVWLSDQDVRTGTAGWKVFDDGEYLELGKLKGNQGDQVYPVPADVDIAAFKSVSIWCKRFAVSFGAAKLT